MPTVTRKVQKIMVAFGRSSTGKSFKRAPRRPGDVSGSWNPVWGFQAHVWFPPAACRAIKQNRRRAASCLEMAFHGGNLAGWCSSVLSPCASPATICIRATIAIRIAMENMMRAARFFRSRSNAAHGPNGKGGGRAGRQHHVDETIWKTWIEYRVQLTTTARDVLDHGRRVAANCWRQIQNAENSVQSPPSWWP